MMSGMVLDTNVLSELMRPRPDAQVVAWFAERSEISVEHHVLAAPTVGLAR